MAEFMAKGANNLANLKSLSGTESVLIERRLLEIRELADQLINCALEEYGELNDVYELLSILSEDYESAQADIHPEAMDENKPMLQRYLEGFGTLDKRLFCKALPEICQGRGIDLSEVGFIANRSAKSTYTYVKNPLSDEAYDVFTEGDADSRVFYSPGFKEAAGAVLDGAVDWCLLPLEERGDRIHSVNQIIFNHDLKIVDVTPVFGLDGMSDMKYAKIGKYLNLPKTGEDDDRYLEIRIPTDSGESVGEIISMAELYGNSVYRINTEAFLADGEERVYYSIVFRDEGGGFARLLTYLTLFTGEYILVGIYKNLE